MKTLILAISGGVDSVVLLDKLARQSSDQRLIVAHVDHGIRQESSQDAEFVRALASKYQLDFVTKRFELGEQASEDSAREARYGFLLELADKYQADIATAHHRDDVIGSVVINLIRGTGWRGLAVMNRPRVTRPLLKFSKSQLYDYALDNRLEWVEDATNFDKKYLRNRLRAGVLSLDLSDQQALLELRDQQIQVAQKIAVEARRLVGLAKESRYFYSVIDDTVASELLYFLVLDKTGVSLTRKTLDRAIVAIKTAQPNTYHDLASGWRLKFLRDSFIVDQHL